MPQKNSNTDEICRDSWNRAVDAFGTGKVFAERAITHKRNISALTYLGIAVPASLGAVVATYGLDLSLLPCAVNLAGGLGIVQLLISVLAVVKDWTGNLEYSNESAAENFYLSKKFEQLGRLAQNPPQDLKSRYEKYISIDDSRSAQDTKRGVTDKELKKAHRYGLRQYQRECVGCKITPTDMKSTNCGICGNF